MQHILWHQKMKASILSMKYSLDGQCKRRINSIYLNYYSCSSSCSSQKSYSKNGMRPVEAISWSHRGNSIRRSSCYRLQSLYWVLCLNAWWCLLSICYGKASLIINPLILSRVKTKETLDKSIVSVRYITLISTTRLYRWRWVLQFHESMSSNIYDYVRRDKWFKSQ